MKFVTMIMAQPGAVAPVVFGGKIRAVMAYLDREQMQARGLVAAGRDEGAGRLQRLLAHAATPSSARWTTSSTPTRCTRRSRTWATSPCGTSRGGRVYLRDVATPKDANYIQTNVVRVNGKREVYIPVYRQLGASTLEVVTNSGGSLKEYGRAADPVGDQSQAGDGPVGLRAEIDRGAGPGRGAGGRSSARWSS